MRFVPLMLLALVGCDYLSVRDAPDTEQSGLDSPGCEGTRTDLACLSLAFSLKHQVRRDAEGDLVGRMEWGLYEGGTVSLTGPEDPDAKLYGTPEPPPNPEALPLVDFNATPEYVVTLPNLAPGSYQLVVYLDDDGSGEPDAGDPASFPNEAFDVPSGKHTRADAVLDFLLF